MNRRTPQTTVQKSSVGGGRTPAHHAGGKPSASKASTDAKAKVGVKPAKPNDDPGTKNKVIIERINAPPKH